MSRYKWPFQSSVEHWNGARGKLASEYTRETVHCQSDHHLIPAMRPISK